MKIKSYMSLLVILLFLISNSYAKYSLDILVQPWVKLSENGSWSSNADSDPGIHRAKISFNANNKILSSRKLRTKLSLDFAEKQIEDILKNANVSFEPIGQFGITVGKLKVPFASHDQISSKNLTSIYRSNSTNHLKNDINVAGYHYGALFYGKFDKIFEYNVGVFKYENNNISGFSIKDIFDFPVVSIAVKPIDPLILSYGITLPQAGTTLENGEVEYNRFLLHDISIGYKLKNNLYETFLNALIAVDTSEVKIAQQLLSEYNENIAFSIYSSHTFKFNFKKKIKILSTSAFEYLNGLNLGPNDDLINRSYYFTLSEDLMFKLKNKFSIQFSYKTNLDESFKSIHDQCFTAQVSYFDKFNFKKRK